MMDNDEKLITKFFAENKQEFADNGFSGRVMRRLPAPKAVRLNRIWTLFCVVAGTVLIVITGGLTNFRMLLHNLLGDFIGGFASINFHDISPSMTFLFFIALVSVAGYNAIVSER